MGTLQAGFKNVDSYFRNVVLQALRFMCWLFSVSDQEAPFMRTGSQEEVSEYWVSVRSDLTLDYKRKRKDAVRRQNKLAAKRTKLR